MSSMVTTRTTLRNIKSLGSLTRRSPSSKRNFQAPNFSTVTDTIVCWRTREMPPISLKSRSRPLKKEINRSSMRIETTTHRRCLKMQPGSKSCKPRKKRRQEILKRSLLMLLRRTTSMLTLLLININHLWKVRLPRPSNLRKKLKDNKKITKKSSSKSPKMLKMKRKILRARMNKTRSRLMRCLLSPRPSCS